MRFQDKGVIVTGAGSGIGRQTCFEFAREGAVVAASDIDVAMAQRTADEITQEGGKAHAFAVDVTDPKSVTDCVEEAAQVLGRLDVLVCSAGIREIVPVLELSHEEWSRVINVNITGVFLCSQAFGRHLVAAGKPGAIVNLASTLGVVASPNRAAYTASKHAVVGLTKEMAMEFGEKDIRVNAVGRGVIRTPLTERYFQDAEYADKIRSVHAMNRWGEPPEIAKAILFLASDDASFCTGTTLIVDGGWTAGKTL
ncbi:MAG: glucose 1-dehydrogenase [Alphaproteobacteria bacterium]|nr:glucose 1-dehydrogenase [Alphaproteobacteria bacterium]